MSDPDDMNMYKTIMKGGLTLYMSHRGTSQIEGLHSHLNRLWVGACHISLALGIELYRARALRWNHDRLVDYFGMRHPGVYTYGYVFPPIYPLLLFWNISSRMNHVQQSLQTPAT